MAALLEKISLEAVELSRQERILLELDSPSTGNDVEETWDREIRDRVRAVDEGCGSGIPYDEIKQEMKRRFGNR